MTNIDADVRAVAAVRGAVVRVALQPMVRIAASVIALVLLTGMSAAESGQSGPSNAWQCLVPTTAPCFTRRGRLSGQNGIAHMIWLVGTNRIVGVHATQIPAMLGKYLAMTSPDHSDVYGDFEICPLEPDRPGHMRLACVAGATRLVVQDRERSRPPLRLLSTWPQKDEK